MDGQNWGLWNASQYLCAVCRFEGAGFIANIYLQPGGVAWNFQNIYPTCCVKWTQQPCATYLCWYGSNHTLHEKCQAMADLGIKVIRVPVVWALFADALAEVVSEIALSEAQTGGCFSLFFQVFHETMTMTMTKKSHKTRKSEFKRSKSIAEAPIYGQHDPHTEHAVDSCLKQLRETFRMSRTPDPGMLGVLILDLFGLRSPWQKKQDEPQLQFFQFPFLWKLGIKFKENRMFVRFRFGLCLVQISRRMCAQNHAGLYIYANFVVIRINLFNFWLKTSRFRENIMIQSQFAGTFFVNSFAWFTSAKPRFQIHSILKRLP